jgi:predicted PurR-regulated permease PerM|tara:strand:+ start:156 stop:431 length:276 start_codon:yes stop_codon:yes gene_type:complete
MNKKNLLMSLIIFQGALIVIGVIVIAYTIIAKIQNSDKKTNNLLNKTNSDQIFLLNENQYQIKRIIGNKIIFDIYNLENSLKVQTIIINEN